MEKPGLGRRPRSGLTISWQDTRKTRHRMTFEELGLSEKVLKAVADAGFKEPTEIQKGAIPPALAAQDVLGLAQTGSGKTAAFALPMLTRLERGRARARMPRTLILEPTRELAAQVHEAFEKLGKYHRLKIALLIGGVSFDEQSRIIDRGADVLIATPGRLLDHFERGKLLLTGVEVLVIDEADRMLDMGFIPDIEQIVKLLPFTRQTLFFSATMPPEIQRLTEQFLHLPVVVEAQPPSSTAETIDQKLVFAPQDEKAKRERLREVIDRQENIRNAIIFANRKKTVEILMKSLRKHGYNAGALHGDMDQYARLETLEAFRDNRITFLVASDVAARGLDIPEVSHVINYDAPVSPEDYVHRIGRTGRAGREGVAVTLVTPEDFKVIAAIEKLIGKEIPWEGEAPTREEIEEASRRKKGRGRSRSARGKGSEKKADRPRRSRSGRKHEDASPVTEQGAAAQADTDREHAGERKAKKKRRRRKRPSGGASANAVSTPQAAVAEPSASKEVTGGKGDEPSSKNEGAQQQRKASSDNGNGKDGKRKSAFHEGNMPAFLARPVERE